MKQTITLVLASFVISVACVASGFCQCNGSRFDHDKYFNDRVRALDSDTGQVFERPEIRKSILENWFRDGIVDSFWTQLYKDNSIDQIFLTVETRYLFLDEPDPALYEVTVVIREDGKFKLCQWPAHMRTPKDPNTVREGWLRNRPIFYREIPKDTFQVFWDCFNSIYEPFTKESSENPKFASTTPLVTVVNVCDSSESNTFWITLTALRPPDNLPDLLYFIDLTRDFRPRDTCLGMPSNSYWDDLNLRPWPGSDK